MAHRWADRPPGRGGVRPRRKGAGLIMAHMDPLDFALMDGAGDAVKRVADDPVAPLDAGGLQRFDQYIGYPFAHGEPPAFIGHAFSAAYAYSSTRPAASCCRSNC